MFFLRRTNRKKLAKLRANAILSLPAVRKNIWASHKSVSSPHCWHRKSETNSKREWRNWNWWNYGFYVWISLRFEYVWVHGVLCAARSFNSTFSKHKNQNHIFAFENPENINHRFQLAPQQKTKTCTLSNRLILCRINIENPIRKHFYTF